MQIGAGAVTLFIAMLLLLAGLALYASQVGKRSQEPVGEVPTGNPSMERKVVAVLAILIVSGILLIAYGLLEPTRQAFAANRQEKISMERAVETYTTQCMGCHGIDGGGAVVPGSNPPRVAPQLNRADMRPTDPDEYKKKYDYVFKTIQRGRPGTPMPSWGKSDGGALLDEQIHELALLITKGDKEIEGHETAWQVAREHAVEKIAHGATEPTVPDIELSAELSDEEKLGARLWQGKGACIGCHAISGVGGQTGPDQTHMATIAATRVPGQGPEVYIHTSMLQPTAYVVPGFPPVMPSFQGILTDAEVDAIVAFLMTQK